MCGTRPHIAVRFGVGVCTRAILLLGFAGTVHLLGEGSTTKITLCHVVPDPSIYVVFGSNTNLSASCVAQYRECCKISDIPFAAGDARVEFSLNAEIIQDNHPLHTSFRSTLQLFPDAARNYGFLFSNEFGPAYAKFTMPSALFKDKVPDNFTRYVWQNLCGDCGNVSAYVDIEQNIRVTELPMIYAGSVGSDLQQAAWDEVTPLPGPPKGTKAYFTRYSKNNDPQAKAKKFAETDFLYAESQFVGKEPYFALLAKDLAVSWVYGTNPIFQKFSKGKSGSTSDVGRFALT